MRDIAVITPVLEIEKARVPYLKMLNLPQLDFEILALARGISGVATTVDKVLIAPEVMRTAYLSAQAGSKVIIINCATEPALIACQELLSIPVFSILECGVQKALQHGEYFVILTPFFHPNYKQLLKAKLASLRYSNTNPNPTFKVV